MHGKSTSEFFGHAPQCQQIGFPVDININDAALRHPHSHLRRLTMPPKLSALLPSAFSILSAAAVIYLPYNCMWILILVAGGTSLLFEYLSPTILLPNQLITLRVWFGTWCLKSAILLICLKLFLSIVLSIQGHLARFTVEILKCLQLYQLVLLGFIGWLFSHGPRIYRFCVMNSPKECESQGIGDNQAVNCLSPSERFALIQWR